MVLEMNETTILLVIMGALGCIEIFLILSIRRLVKSLDGMNGRLGRFEDKLTEIGVHTKSVMDILKPASKMLESGELNVHVKSPLGDGELKLKLEGKKEVHVQKSIDPGIETVVDDDYWQSRKPTEI